MPPPDRRLLAAWIEQPPPDREAEALQAFVQRTIAQPDGRVRGISGGWLEEQEARRLRELGLPVGTETARVLTSDAVRHVWRLHGPAAARTPGEPPVTADDIANWRTFIAAAHDTARTITDARGAQPGRDAVAHLARDAQGRLVVVEEYRSRTGVLALATMFRLPEGSGIARLEQVPGMAERMRRAQAAPPMHDASRRAGFPVLTSRTLEGSPDAIPRAAARFNARTRALRDPPYSARVAGWNSSSGAASRGARPSAWA